MTRDQALAQLTTRLLTAHEREQILQYLHYLDAEGLPGVPRPTHSAKRPTQKNRTKR